jgi:hypothetical protein
MGKATISRDLVDCCTVQQSKPITLPRAVADYLGEFHLAAVYVSRGGKIGVATPSHLSRRGAVVAWWCASRCEAEAVLTAIGERHPGGVEAAERQLKLAASRLGTTLADHGMVLASARAAIVHGREAA